MKRFMKLLESNLWAGVALLLLVAVAFVACGSSGGTSGSRSGSSATATGAPDAASILQQVRSASTNIRDATFKIAATSPAASQSLNGTGTGKLTRSPDRVQVSLNGNVGGQQGAFDIILDKGTSVTYVRAPQQSEKWLKVPAAAGSTEDIGNFNLTHPALVGEATINGEPSYHLRGLEEAAAATTPGATPATASAATDLWVTKNSYYPVRSVTKAEDGTTVTVNFTSVNTGVTVELPPSAQIVNP